MLVIVVVLEGRAQHVHALSGPCVIGAAGSAIVLPGVQPRARIAPDASGNARLTVDGDERALAAGESFALGPYQVTLVQMPATGLSEHRELEALFYLSSHFENLSSLRQLLTAMLERLELVFRAERGAILLVRDGKGLEVALLHTREAGGREFQFSRTVTDSVFKTGKPVLCSDVSGADTLDGASSIHDQSIRSVMCAPLTDGKRVLGVVYLDSRMASRVFDTADRDLFARFATNVAGAVGSQRERDRLKKDVHVLTRLNRESAKLEHDPEGIVVGSKRMRELMEQVEMLAASDTTALVLGESGTGKELIAKAIHARSKRRDGLLVPVNVMALSSTVVESELFGHEKGAFTGANERRIGRFEMAHGGTLFLDECAELSLEMQVKLLRVLEAREIERVGGGRPIEVDVRLVCATNADLRALISAGKFREDLYYRLNVFSLTIPPLRKRREEIPLLVDHFIRRFRARGGKPIEGITGEALAYLQQYDWPGNVRELRNVIERAFVLERELNITPQSLPFDLVREAPAAAPVQDNLAARLAAQQEVLVRAALEKHQGNISQAARELGITRKTLYKRMREYGMQGPAEEATED